MTYNYQQQYYLKSLFVLVFTISYPSYLFLFVTVFTISYQNYAPQT